MFQIKNNGRQHPSWGGQSHGLKYVPTETKLELIIEIWIDKLE